jgi:hypothetical protein
VFFQRSKDTEVALEAFGVVVGNILFYEWLEDFEMFSIYEILPEILELWGDNLITQVDVKKTGKEQSGNDDCSVPAALYRGRDFYPRSGPADDRHGSGYLCRKME